MQLIDCDGLFDEKLAQYIEQNKNKYTEKQDKIKKLPIVVTNKMFRLQ